MLSLILKSLEQEVVVCHLELQLMVHVRLSHLLWRVILSLFLNRSQAEALLFYQLERGDGSFPLDFISDRRVPAAQGLLGALAFVII